MPGILFAVLASIAFTVIFDLTSKGVDVIGVLPQGFPRPTFPGVALADLPLLAAAALGMTLLAVGDTISTSTGFAARRGYEVDAELKDPARAQIERYGLYDTIDSRHFYPTLDVAVQAFNDETAGG